MAFKLRNWVGWGCEDGLNRSWGDMHMIIHDMRILLESRKIFIKLNVMFRYLGWDGMRPLCCSFGVWGMGGTTCTHHTTFGKREGEVRSIVGGSFGEGMVGWDILLLMYAMQGRYHDIFDWRWRACMGEGITMHESFGLGKGRNRMLHIEPMKRVAKAHNQSKRLEDLRGGYDMKNTSGKAAHLAWEVTTTSGKAAHYVDKAKDYTNSKRMHTAKRNGNPSYTPNGYGSSGFLALGCSSPLTINQQPLSGAKGRSEYPNLPTCGALGSSGSAPVTVIACLNPIMVTQTNQTPMDVTSSPKDSPRQQPAPAPQQPAPAPCQGGKDSPNQQPAPPDCPVPGAGSSDHSNDMGVDSGLADSMDVEVNVLNNNGIYGISDAQKQVILNCMRDFKYVQAEAVEEWSQGEWDFFADKCMEMGLDPENSILYPEEDSEIVDVEDIDGFDSVHAVSHLKKLGAYVDPVVSNASNRVDVGLVVGVGLCGKEAEGYKQLEGHLFFVWDLE
ncbi:hypothetical protein L1987_79573 [Smallanthus sonchifolius]|uniref:Uncharacterized protein n=1 Tax=Smallanthus sonchifolius TaxID=185202 RepID=A0ACB8ZF15_9ASTR|nr:hypothetical protein L1987_79573 [Smallanthus sonchifolius]